LMDDFLKNIRPTSGDVIPIKFLRMEGGGCGHRLPHVRIAQKQIQLLSKLLVGLSEQAGFAMHNVLRTVNVHSDGWSAASRRLSQHLWVAFENTREQENISPSHFLSELRGVQMAEKDNVSTSQLRRQRAAGGLGFAPSR